MNTRILGNTLPHRFLISLIAILCQFRFYSIFYDSLSIYYVYLSIQLSGKLYNVTFLADLFGKCETFFSTLAPSIQAQRSVRWQRKLTRQVRRRVWTGNSTISWIFHLADLFSILFFFLFFFFPPAHTHTGDTRV
jgi:hypothetical protein